MSGQLLSAMPDSQLALVSGRVLSCETREPEVTAVVIQDTSMHLAAYSTLRLQNYAFFAAHHRP